MEFDDKIVLVGLTVLPVVAALMAWARRQQRRASLRFAGPVMGRRLFPLSSRPRAWIKGVVLLAGIALVIAAAARPRFGIYFERVSQRGIDLMVLLDVSRSMMAADVAPNRLERAKSDIRDLLARLRGDHVGLIVFAGRPLLKVPLTGDKELLLTVLEGTDTQSAGQGGTRIGDAIFQGLEALPRRANRDQVLLLISDGEDHDSDPREAASQAYQRGVKIFAVGLGDSRVGARIPVSPKEGQIEYLAYGGRDHWSKLDGTLLGDIALITHGAYIPAGTRLYDLGQVYEEHLARLPQSDVLIGRLKRYREQFQLFLALGLLLLAVEMGISSHPRRDSALGRPERLP